MSRSADARTTEPGEHGVNVRGYAERALVGALLRAPEMVANADQWPPPSVFYDRTYQRLHRYILLAIEAGTAPPTGPIDQMALGWARALRQISQDRVGVDAAYLAGLMNGCPKAENARGYAEIVLEAHVIRLVGGQATELVGA